jgi:hypothetical protein
VVGETNLSVGLAIEIKLPDLITVCTMSLLRTDETIHADKPESEPRQAQPSPNLQDFMSGMEDLWGATMKLDKA